jgi:hypothetical protein
MNRQDAASERPLTATSPCEGYRRARSSKNENTAAFVHKTAADRQSPFLPGRGGGGGWGGSHDRHSGGGSEQRTGPGGVSLPLDLPTTKRGAAVGGSA